MSSAANSTIADYEYQPLDHATQQIRLVTLLDPLENDDAIRLDIEVFEISEAPPYTALSYVWGRPPSNHDVYIANGRLEIRENLFQFLTEFRKCRDKTPSDRYLWIDQLCIDQLSTAERNHQVQMMSDIYSKATSVIAWLGDGSEKACAPPELLAERGCGKFDNMYDAACAWKDVGEQAALAYILHNEYFGRLWIVQEFILARQIRVLVKGVWLVNDTRGWECRFETLDHYLRRSVPNTPYYIMSKSSLRRTGGFVSLDICIVLGDYMSNACVDPLDKVYGLLGLVRLDQSVTVDYEKPTDQLYLDLMLIALQSQCFEELAEARATFKNVDLALTQAAHALHIAWADQFNFDCHFPKVWQSDRLGRFRGHACPITAVGIEKAAMTDSEVDQFWFDFQGTRHFIACTDDTTCLADETEQLLQEDWEKYVPQARACIVRVRTV